MRFEVDQVLALCGAFCALPLGTLDKDFFFVAQWLIATGSSSRDSPKPDLDSLRTSVEPSLFHGRHYA